MAKKDAPRGASKSDESVKLTHNPFAALAPKRDGLPTAENPPKPSEAAPAAGAAAPAVALPPAHPVAPPERGKTRGRLVLRRETKHRGGKAVIVIQGLASLRDFDDDMVDALAKALKNKLGCGGTVERSGADTQIILQGDRPAKVAELLRERGFRVDGVTS